MTALLDELKAARDLDAERLAPDDVEADVEEAVAATWGSAITIVERWSSAREAGFHGTATALLNAVEEVIETSDRSTRWKLPAVERLRRAYNAVLAAANER